jgi:hypothetical protein
MVAIKPRRICPTDRNIKKEVRSPRKEKAL